LWNFFPAVRVQFPEGLIRIFCEADRGTPLSHSTERSKQHMLSTLELLFKLLGTSSLPKLLLLLLKAIFA
jgi:hypothetical protein